MSETRRDVSATRSARFPRTRDQNRSGAARRADWGRVSGRSGGRSVSDTQCSDTRVVPSANSLEEIHVCLRDPLNGQILRVGRVASREERDVTAEEGGAAAVHSRKAGRPASTWTISNFAIRVPASSPSPNSVMGRFLGGSFELVLASLDSPRAKPAEVDSQWSRESLALLSPQ